MLSNILPAHVISKLTNLSEVTEVRLRINKPLYFSLGKQFIKSNYIVTRQDIDYVTLIASEGSIYAVQDMLIKGYLTCPLGVRVGLSGEGILESGKIVALKNISSLTIRLPHAVVGIADNLADIINNFKNTLIVSPPGAGKTTLLREMVRKMSNNGNNVMLIDERGEISATVEGVNMLDVGTCTDVLVNIPKIDCYESGVRTMSPNIVATDEIFGRAEVDCIVDCIRCGVKVLASVHGDSIDSVIKNERYKSLAMVMDNYILLSAKHKVGSIVEVRKNCLD